MNEKEKKRKRMCTSNQKRKSTKLRDHKDPEPPHWSQLPATIVIEIYKNLGDLDRVSMARVCKTWYQGFHVPELWKHRHVRLGGQRPQQNALMKSAAATPMSYGNYAIKFVKQFPTSLEDIEISLRIMPGLEVKKIVNYFKTFSACLDGAKLRNISISYLDADRVSGRTKKDVIDSLKRLLRNQHSVRKFITEPALFDIESGLEILKCLAEASAPTIQDLALPHFFLDGMSIYREGRVLTEMQKFTALSCINFDYNLMSEELVKTWVTGCPNLSLIKLCAHDQVHPWHVVSCEAWKSLVRTHPNLLVEFEASEIKDSKQLVDILSPAIPLVYLSWYTFKNTSEFELTRLLNRVANYHRTIKNLCLRLSGTFPNLDTTAVQNILSKCTNLLPFKCYTYEDAWGLLQETSWLREDDI